MRAGPVAPRSRLTLTLMSKRPAAVAGLENSSSRPSASWSTRSRLAMHTGSTSALREVGWTCHVRPRSRVV